MALWDNAACMEMDRWLTARGIRVSTPTLGTTVGGSHTKGSNHYPAGPPRYGPPGSTGQARDYGTYGSDCQRIADALRPFATGKNYVISELIWTPPHARGPGYEGGTYFKRGVAYRPSRTLAEGLWPPWPVRGRGGHTDHVHAAPCPGARLRGGHVLQTGRGLPPEPRAGRGALAALAAARSRWPHRPRPRRHRGWQTPARRHYPATTSTPAHSERIPHGTQRQAAG